jgi:hypothetical protein
MCEPWAGDKRQGHLAHSRSHHPSKFNNSLHVLFWVCIMQSAFHIVIKTLRGSPAFPIMSSYILTQTCLWCPSVDSLWPHVFTFLMYTDCSREKTFHSQLKFSLHWLTWCLLSKFLSDQDRGINLVALVLIIGNMVSARFSETLKVWIKCVPHLS